MVHKHPASVVIRKMQIKTPIKYHFTSPKSKPVNSSFSKNVGLSEVSFTAEGRADGNYHKEELITTY